MKKSAKVLGLGLFILGVCFVGGQTPQNYIYTSSGDLHGIEKLITRKDIGGVSITGKLWKHQKMYMIFLLLRKI